MLKNSVKISFLVYIISLFTISEHETLYVISNLCFMLFIMCSVLDCINKKRIIVNNIILVYMFFSAYVVISCFWAPILSDAVTRTLTVLQLLIMLFVIYNSFAQEECIDFLVRCLWVGGLSLCILFLFKYSMTEIVESYTIKLRLGEEIAPLNAVGRNLGIFVVINLYYMLIQGKRRYILPCILGILIMSTTQSRTSLLLCFAGGLVIAAFKVRESKLARLAVILMGIALLFLIVKSDTVRAMFWRVYKMFIFLTDTSNKDIDYSAFIRLGLIKKGLGFIVNNPLFGYGVASGYSLLNRDYFHNNYIQVWVEMGLVGILCYYLPILYIIYKALRQSHKKQNRVTVILLTMLLAGDFVNATYYHKITYVLLGIALCVVSDKRKKGCPQNESC